MKKTTVIIGTIAALLVLILVFAATASADNGPHGNFGAGDTTSTTDSCGGCHRTHTAGADTLLRWGPTEYDFCTQCHGPISQGAVTNVVDGVIQAVGPTYEYPDASITSKQTTPGLPLNGGGFEYARMYIPATDLIGSPVSATSKHRVEGVDGGSGNVVAWGGGGNNSGGPGIFGLLRCSSCHDPHGSPNYRILNPGYQNGGAASGAWTTLAATWAVGYMISSPGQEPMVGSNEIPNSAHNYASKLNVFYDYGISDFCGGCHQQYLNNRANGYDSANPYDAGDGQGTVAHFRHAVSSKGYYTSDTQRWVTSSGPYRADAAFVAAYPADTTGRALRRVVDAIGGSRTVPDFVAGASGNYNGTLVTCLTCHYAHGSGAQAVGWASNVPPSNDSANLYLDNRGVCQACHGKGPGPGQY